MTLPQAAPEDSGPARAEHFPYCGTAPDARWFAYIAGPAMWFHCHQPKKTKPCLTIMTNRAVPCPWCGAEEEPVVRGYVPLYRAIDTAPRCIIVSDLYRDVCDKFKLHERVQIGKESEKGDPVWITRALSAQPSFATTLRHRMYNVDLTPSLLRIWGNDALKEWYRTTIGKSDKPVSLPKGTAVHADGSPVSPMLQGAAKRVGFDVLPVASADDEQAVEKERELLRAVQRGEQPSTNGHLKKRSRKQE